MSLDLNRTSALLRSESKEKKKQALNDVQSLLALETGTDCLSEWWTVLNKPLCWLLNDPVESCRDSALESLGMFLSTVPPDDRDIAYLIPVLSRRLGMQELVETSEEVRLRCLVLLRAVVERYKSILVPYVQDIVNILVRGLKDNYALVKRESCECTRELATTLPRHFYAVSEQVVAPLLENLGYKHHRIRVAAVKAVGDALLYGNSKSMEEVAVPLAERLFDQNGTVRAAVIQVAGQWLQELRDRYSWWHRILPLLLTGLHDTVEQIRTEASRLWDAAGRLYMKENESDPKFKERMDYLCGDPAHYPNVRRPNLGCRTLAQQNLGKLLNGIIAELSDWKDDIRLRSAQLLCVLILHAESDATQHIAKLVPAMRKAAEDQDQRVVENIKQTAEYIGHFVQPEIYCRFVLSAEPATKGHLRIVAAILRGGRCETLLPRLKLVGEYLAEASVCRSRDSIYQAELLSCCSSIFSTCQQECKTIGEELFAVLFTVLTMAGCEETKLQAHDLLDELQPIAGCKNRIELLNNYLPGYLTGQLSTNRKSWTIYCPESLILCGCLIHAGETLSSNLELVFPLLKETLEEDADPQLKLRVFMTLSGFFVENGGHLANSTGSCEALTRILEDCVAPGLVWTAGGTAEPLRTAAISCLCAALGIYENGNARGDFSLIFEKILPRVVSLCDDRAKKSRLYATRAIGLVSRLGRRWCWVSEKIVSSVYPSLLKRLDDAVNEVRYSALEALVDLWEAAPNGYDLEFNRGHVDAMYTTAVIHLDDPEEKFQRAVLDCLKRLATVHPVLFEQKLQKCRATFRNQPGIDILIEHCRTLITKDSDKFADS